MSALRRCAMTTAKKSTYTPMPEVPQEARDRYLVAMEALSGAITTAEASRRLGISRERMHSLINRGRAALLEAVSQQNPGRPAMSETERTLREENARLQRENERLQ